MSDGDLRVHGDSKARSSGTCSMPTNNQRPSLKVGRRQGPTLRSSDHTHTMIYICPNPCACASAHAHTHIYHIYYICTNKNKNLKIWETFKMQDCTSNCTSSTKARMSSWVRYPLESSTPCSQSQGGEGRKWRMASVTKNFWLAECLRRSQEHLGVHRPCSYSFNEINNFLGMFKNI